MLLTVIGMISYKLLVTQFAQFYSQLFKMYTHTHTHTHTHAAFGIEHWLIMEYHDNGSLCEYLQRNTLTINDLQRILYSISDGLSFLHKPVATSYARSHKPGIAHRDLKTRNILMKRDRTCCIADLGLAVRSNDFENSEKLPKPQQGTKRILAPEILGDTINRTQFQSYCQADVYSMGLVMWECARRTPVQGRCVCVCVCGWVGGRVDMWGECIHACTCVLWCVFTCVCVHVSPRMLKL